MALGGDHQISTSTSASYHFFLNSTKVCPSESRGTRIRVDNIHYELTEEDLDVRTTSFPAFDA